MSRGAAWWTRRPWSGPSRRAGSAGRAWTSRPRSPCRPSTRSGTAPTWSSRPTTPATRRYGRCASWPSWWRTSGAIAPGCRCSTWSTRRAGIEDGRPSEAELTREVGVLGADAPDPRIEDVVRGLGQGQEGDEEGENLRSGQEGGPRKEAGPLVPDQAVPAPFLEPGGHKERGQVERPGVRSEDARERCPRAGKAGPSPDPDEGQVRDAVDEHVGHSEGVVGVQDHDPHVPGQPGRGHDQVLSGAHWPAGRPELHLPQRVDGGDREMDGQEQV